MIAIIVDSLLDIIKSRNRKKEQEWEAWYAEQKDRLHSGEDIEPPWVVFPQSSPIYGWNQGTAEAWKNDIWIPFWNRMNEVEQGDYLKRWKPPSEDWFETLTIFWTGKFKQLNSNKL